MGMIKAAVGVVIVVVIAAGISFFAASRPDDGSTLSDGPRVMAPRGVRIKVQVLNGTDISGLASAATRYLRDRGFDVVESGNSATRTDSTRVLNRSGNGDWAELVARALGVPGSVTEIDSGRFVDVTVVLGRDWSPPPRPFSP
jgi:hypothetical protein